MSARILIVDDDETARHFLLHILTQQGFVAETASDGFQAVQLVRSQKFDMVLLDIEMPVMDGLKALRSIRESFAKKDLPVMMVSAKDQSSEIVLALELGANDYVMKPLDVPVLFARIRSHLDNEIKD